MPNLESFTNFLVLCSVIYIIYFLCKILTYTFIKLKIYFKAFYYSIVVYKDLKKIDLLLRFILFISYTTYNCYFFKCGQFYMADPSQMNSLIEETSKPDIMKLSNILNDDNTTNVNVTQNSYVSTAANSNVFHYNSYVSTRLNSTVFHNNYVSTEAQFAQPSGSSNVQSLRFSTITEKQQFLHESREVIDKLKVADGRMPRNNPRLSLVLEKLSRNEEDKIKKLLDMLNRDYVKGNAELRTGELKSIYVNSRFKNELDMCRLKETNEIRVGTVMYKRLNDLLHKIEKN